MKRFTTSILSISLGAALILQFLFGNLPLTAFAFPVNLALVLALAGITFVLYRENKMYPWLKEWASGTTSITLIALTGIGSLFIAFVPQWNVQQSWPFAILLLLLLNQMLFAIFSYRGRFRKRFYLNHIGLFLFILALSFGAADMHRWKAILHEGETIEQAYDSYGIPHTLGYPLRLESFHISYYENNIPQTFTARVTSDNESQEILVNHPWHKSWKEDIYLTNYGQNEDGSSQYCVVEFITQPWKPVATLSIILTAIGSFLLLFGLKTKNK